MRTEEKKLQRLKMDAMSHDQRIAWLMEHQPIGVPLEPDGWPETFGSLVVHGGKDGYCLQCEMCRKFKVVDADWGVCKSQQSQYGGLLVFEHWTCKDFRP